MTSIDPLDCIAARGSEECDVVSSFFFGRKLLVLLHLPHHLSWGSEQQTFYLLEIDSEEKRGEELWFGLSAS